MHPTPDESAGIAWWNSLDRSQRAHWLAQAGSAVPADAWAAFKAGSEVAAVMADVERAAHAMGY